MMCINEAKQRNHLDVNRPENIWPQLLKTRPKDALIIGGMFLAWLWKWSIFYLFRQEAWIKTGGSLP